ncbi:hypothetical protein HQ40_02070 [Porphyromonas gulae]|uniref:hypothetical protein n=1 Tax=Porphyromonas gulae TaxID=111105 RepID=UPI00052C491E|nr:hypothetical protein [Porphyromonas gulae]KGN76906.1 hypothetical protein HQ40_02070 [Porphyromonas gulae]
MGETWMNIALTALTGSMIGNLILGINAYRFRKQESAQKNAEAITASTNTVESVANAADSAADRYEAAMEKRFKMQEMYYEERERRMELESRIRILENGQRAAEYDRAENRRKILGLQRKLDEMISRTTFAETNICFRDPCPIREPKKGTYNGEKKETQEIQTKEGNESIAG